MTDPVWTYDEYRRGKWGFVILASLLGAPIVYGFSGNWGLVIAFEALTILIGYVTEDPAPQVNEKPSPLLEGWNDGANSCAPYSPVPSDCVVGVRSRQLYRWWLIWADSVMPKSMYTGWLFATYRRTFVAAVLTAFVFMVAARNELNPVQAKPGSLFLVKRGWVVQGGVLHSLHGWSLVAVNLAFWGYLCWAGLWIIYHSEGRERLFFVGLFAGIPFWPVRWLEPRWAEPVTLIGTAGLALALSVAIWTLLHPPNIASTADGDDLPPLRHGQN